jgi:5-oxoprolinase (ATP-hydrolysing)
LISIENEHFLLVLLLFGQHRLKTIIMSKFHFSIDRGGTFTDVHAILPNGQQVVSKLLSEDPQNYPDAPTEGIRRVLEKYSLSSWKYVKGTSKISTDEIGSIRMGTTVATNALLERRGTPMALLITQGFRDVLEIGTQARPNIFDLKCSKPTLLYQRVVEIQERVVLCRESNTSKVESGANSTYPEQGNPKIVKGKTGELIRIVQTPDLEQVRRDMDELKRNGIQALAICLMHSYTFPDHEIAIGKIAEQVGFSQISLSSQVIPMVKLVSR